MDEVWTIFNPQEVPYQLTDMYFLSYFSPQYTKKYHRPYLWHKSF